ncbi:MAG TPA: hypothetical protein VMV49_00560 [Candidatus Deferrimicrobium sp.]|nr:hypothetical protein [Candidatus Deferrimicrobium sp.]
MVINKGWFIEKISAFLSHDESNKMTRVDNSLIFDPNVLVGFVSGADPIFLEYKKIIGTFHFTPAEVYEWFCKKYNLSPVPLNKISVVAFILPINGTTKKQHAEYSKEYPSEKWANTRLFGEQANEKLQQHLVNELKKKG